MNGALAFMIKTKEKVKAETESSAEGRPGGKEDDNLRGTKNQRE
jgi:hypothetical protein